MLRAVGRERALAFVTQGLGVLAAVVMGYPLFWMLITSVKQNPDIFRTPPRFFPTLPPTLAHFRSLLETTNYLLYLRNSVVIALAATALAVLVAIPAAYGLTRYSFRFKQQMASFVLLLYLFPPIMLIIPLFVLFTGLGLSNTLTGLIIAHTTFTLPFALWLLWAFFRTIPLTLEEAAWMDGASRGRAVRDIILPLSLPGIACVAIFTFVVSWSDYFFAFAFVTEEGIKTITLGAYALIDIEAAEWGRVLAAGVLIAFPPLLGLFFMQKYLMRGFGVPGV
jgi:ABC-type glycerol-3-phosphate transport system permease component